MRGPDLTEKNLVRMMVGRGLDDHRRRVAWSRASRMLQRGAA